MYVWARFARMALTAKSRGAYRVGDESRLTFRCLPTDIDFNIHLNNARYMMLADLGRLDIFNRAGVVSLVRKRGWAMVLGGLQAVYMREIKLWRRFEVVSSIDAWDGPQVLGAHRFVLENGETAALVKTTAGVYDRKGRRFVDIQELVNALGYDASPRALTEAEKAFMASHQGLRAAAKGGV